MFVEAAGSQQLLKVINRMAVVRHLCSNPSQSRADLATALGLTKSTISQLVRELIAEGWVEEREIVATGDLGRRPTPLFINASRLLLLGAEVGIESVRVVASSLVGEVRATVELPYGQAKSAKACMAVLATALQKACRTLDPKRHQILGIGVGLPGGVDELAGMLHFAPNLGWRDVPVAALLAEKLIGTMLEGVPLYLQNEADVAALGEMEFNGAQTADPLLYLSINQGVGAGVIVGGRLLTGHRGFAGEVGHVILQINGPLCTCGRRGCAEAAIGLRAMLPSDHRASPTPDACTLAEIQRRLEAGDAGTGRAVKRAGNFLGVLLQNLVAAYDPAVVVIGGACVELGNAFVQPALDTLHRYAAAANLPPPTVQLSRFGANAVATGAAALARHRLTRPLAAPGVSA